ncbi:uroporphyrinogen-III synthase [Vibrio maerlii]|uniref:uroporphyrinogen-III synthase n=1 Tax=Vibrio maerlii TaxID=2231648 RepID=UPI000E3B6186|nr:uroporphyrinogen-III synthase [Vibrio maerlii]
MTVLVTRPAPQGQALCQMLDLTDIPTLYQPLITILPGAELDQLATMLTSADIVIAVSQHAIEHSQNVLSAHNQAWPKKTYLAIGQKTAHSLSTVAEQKVNYPETSDSEHFLLLPELQHIDGKKVLILRGNGGRELIKQALEEHGAIVSYCETYQRAPQEIECQQLVASWQQNSVDTIVVTSGEQLQLLMEQLPSVEHSWITQQYLVVPSSRIAQLANQFGFNKVEISQSASNQDITTALQSIYRTRK